MTSTSTRVRALLYRRVPALDSLRTYSLRAFRSDLLAGFSVATVAVPQAMAYSMIVGLPAEYGLYTAIVMTAVGAVLDSSKQLINGPTNAISIALLSAVGHFADPEQRLQAAVLMGFLIGLIQLSISVLRLGDLTRFISHSVIVGFTAGASLLLVLDQMKNLLGLQAQGDVHDHFLVRFGLTLLHGGPIHTATLAVGLSSIGAVLVLRWFKHRLGLALFPELLVVVAAAAAVTGWLGLDGMGVKVIGEIPAKLPPLRAPHFDAGLVRELASSALAIGLLGLLEAVAMAKAIAAVTRQKLDLNQQVLSEGAANLAGSFFQCIPGSGSLTRSAINQQAGAVTQWSGVVSAVAVAAIMLLLAPYARYIPRAALAGILMLTALRMVNLHDLRFHMRASRFDAVIVAVTATAAVAISIEFCVLIGVVLSFMLAVPRTGNMTLTEFVAGEGGIAHERLPGDPVCDRIRIFGLEGEMFFGSATSLDAHLDTVEERSQGETQVVVLRVKRARNPDAVGLHMLEGLIDRLQARGLVVLLCGVREDMAVSLSRCGILEKIGPDHLFREQPVRQTSTMLAVQYACKLVEPCTHCPRRRIEAHARVLDYGP
jgi:SulP family sulfate permease